MYDTFGPGKQADVSEHEEIELALYKLWRHTNNDKYLELSKLFLERRGHKEGRKPLPKGAEGGWGEVCQDHVPIREQREIFGHAVRAMYLYCGVTDIASITGDSGYLATLDSIWHDVTGRKMYITGGIGDSSRRNEGFSIPYYLPNDTAYCETCASIGMALWNQRMALLHKDARYANIVEREIYNGILGSTSMDGHGFYYCNRLRDDEQRPPWQGCACCPTNIVRFLPSLPGYVYATDENAVYINQYMASKSKLKLAGKEIELVQQTNYPWDGAVQIKVTPPAAMRFALAVRIPAWCEGPQNADDLYKYPARPEKGAAKISVNGADVAVPAPRNGYATIDREWAPGDVVELNMPMPVQRVYANDKVQADKGLVAIQRGPLVYCFEDIDNAGRVGDCVLPATAELKTEHQASLLGGVTTIATNGTLGDGKAAPLTAIPFYARQNRQPSRMQVWMPEDASHIAPRVGVMTFVFESLIKNGMPDEQLMRTLSSKGCKEVEIMSGKLSNPAVMETCKKLIAESRIRVSCIDGISNLSAAEPAEREKAVETLRAAIGYAAELRCPLVLSAGSRLAPGMAPQDARRLIIEGMSKCMPAAKEAGVTLAIEDFGVEPKLQCAAKDCLEILQAVPGLKFVFDTGNFYLAGENPLDNIAPLAEYVVHVHLKNWEKSDKPQIADVTGTPVDKGLIANKELAAKFMAMGIKSYSIEFGAPGDIIEGAIRDINTLRGWLSE
jgi:DUF1680 family protein/sugar phosphate isomerase/epimerase